MKKEQLVMTKHLVLVAVLLLVGCHLLQAQNLLPTLKLKVSPMTAVVPATVVLTATCPTCVAYAWDFGDGTSNSVPGSAQTHVYSTSGQFDAVVAATDKNGNPVEADVLITLSSSSLADNRYCGLGDVWLGGVSDGPAELPRTCLNTSLQNTPSPGTVTRVLSTVLTGGSNSLQVAYNAAKCGDTLVVAHGTKWQFGWPGMLFPSKNCDNLHWITIKTDGTLPSEGIRIDPTYASQMFNIIVRGSNHLVINGDHIRFIGMEMSKDAVGGATTNFAEVTGADSIIFDRVYMHGTPNLESRRAIYIGGSTNVGIIDSYLSEFHCIAVTGSCTDSEAIAVGDTTLPQLTFTFTNNYLEAAGENILFGGELSGLTIPADVQIRRNTFNKPISWMSTSPSWVGPNKYIVKNLLEFKNAKRVLVEGNTMTNCWGGFSQVGNGIVMTPRGAWAAVEDITVRYDTLAHLGEAFQIAATKGPNASPLDSLALQRVSIHDVLVEDLDGAHYKGAGGVFQVSTLFSNNAPLNGLAVSHVTAFTDSKGSLMFVGDDLVNPVKPTNIVFMNNIFGAGTYPVWSTGGGPTACSAKDQPLLTFNACWTSYSFTNNVIPVFKGLGSWPAGNSTPTSWAAVGFVNYNNGSGGDYRLSPTSAYKGKASDGTDPGADLDAIKNAIN